MDGCRVFGDHGWMPSRFVLCAVAVLAVARPALADEAAGQVFPGPFDRLAGNLADSFLGPGMAFQLAAVAATATLSSQDADARAFRYFRDHPRWGRAAYPVIILGAAGPVALMGGLHVAGRMTGNAETAGAAYAVLQAGALTVAYVTVLKLVTGRPAPNEDHIPSLAANDTELSRTFRPGVYQGGVIAGWPSGHVAVTTAVLTSLAFYYPESWLLKAAAVLGSAGMMLAVSSFEAGSMHWTSDAVAGALMAFPIGMATGRGMRRVVDGGKPARASAWFVTPSPRPEIKGALVGFVF